MRDIFVRYEPNMEDYRLESASFIEGLPGIGLVAKIAVAYLLSKVKHSKICRIHSLHFPNLVYVSDNKLLSTFTDVYAVEEPAPVLVMYGNAQPSSSYGQYVFCNTVMDLAIRHGATRVFTVGGLGGKDKITLRREIYCSSSKRDYLEKYVKIVDGQVYSGQIVGAVGLLSTIAGMKSVENMGMLVEISDSVPDYYAAKRAAEALSVLTGLNVPIGDVEDLIKTSARYGIMLESS